MAQVVFVGPASIKLQLKGQTFDNLQQLQRETNKITRGYSTAWFLMLHVLRDSGLNDINDAYSILRHTFRKSETSLFVIDCGRRHWCRNVNCAMLWLRLDGTFILAISVCTVCLV